MRKFGVCLVAFSVLFVVAVLAFSLGGSNVFPFFEDEDSIGSLTLSSLLRFLLYPSTAWFSPFFFFLRLWTSPPTFLWSSTLHDIEGLQGETVRILRDGLGVPYIYAETEEDAHFSQGLLHALDRPWQLEMLRKVTKGELSLIMGRGTLNLDRISRTLGFYRRGQKLVKELRQMVENEKKEKNEMEATGKMMGGRERREEMKYTRDYNILSAYSSGVSEGLRRVSLSSSQPFEGFVLRYSLNTSWEIEDSLAVFRLMMFSFSRGWTGELAKALLNIKVREDQRMKEEEERRTGGREFVEGNELEIHYDEDIPFINPEGPQALFRELYKVEETEERNDFEDFQKDEHYPIPSPMSSWAAKRPLGFKERVDEGRKRIRGKEGLESDEMEYERGEQRRDNQKNSEDYGDGNDKEGKRKSEVFNGMPIVGDGSNAWAISGRFSTSNKPLVAGDMHLFLTAPSMFYPTLISIIPNAPSETFPSSSFDSNDSSFTDRMRCCFQDQHNKSETCDHRIIGLSVVGLPGIFSGHTHCFAWSLTYSYIDNSDVFQLQLKSNYTSADLPSSSSSSLPSEYYLYDNKWFPLNTRQEVIYIRGESKPFIFSVRESHHGPVISDIIESLSPLISPNSPIVLASSGLRSPLVGGSFDAPFCRNWKAFKKFAESFGGASLTVTWGDVWGNIGVFLTGSIPRRTGVGKHKIRDGTKSDEDWQGVLEFDELPYLMNPDRGFVYSANSRLSPDPLDQFGKIGTPGHRQKRIKDMLEELTGSVKKQKEEEETEWSTKMKDEKKISLKEFEVMQSDLFSIQGKQWMDLMKTLLSGSSAPSDSSSSSSDELASSRDVSEGNDEWNVWQSCRAIAGNEEGGEEWGDNLKTQPLKEKIVDVLGVVASQLLSEWDYFMYPNSSATTIFEVWIQYSAQFLFSRAGLSDESFKLFSGFPINNEITILSELRLHWRMTLLRLLQIPGSKIVKRAGGGKIVVCWAFRETLEFLRAKCGLNLKRDWQWGKVHHVFFTHFMSKRFSILRHTLGGPGPFKPGGNPFTLSVSHPQNQLLNRNDTAKTSGYTRNPIGPLSRFLMDTGNWKQSRWVIPPGVSGWVGSKHYDDQAKAWEQKKYFSMLWEKKDIEDAAVSEMTLQKKKRERGGEAVDEKEKDEEKRERREEEL